MEGCLCDIGAACDDGLMCVEGTCTAMPACRPLDEDGHDDEDTALSLDMLNCDESNDIMGAGTVEGPQVDWWVFGGQASFGCPEQPAAAVTSDVDLDVCVYIECLDGSAVGVQCVDSVDTESPGGRPGCCGTNAAQFEGYDCSGIGSGKDVDVYLSIASADLVCADYDVEYSF